MLIYVITIMIIPSRHGFRKFAKVNVMILLKLPIRQHRDVSADRLVPILFSQNYLLLIIAYKKAENSFISKNILEKAVSIVAARIYLQSSLSGQKGIGAGLILWLIRTPTLDYAREYMISYYVYTSVPERPPRELRSYILWSLNGD